MKDRSASSRTDGRMRRLAIAAGLVLMVFYGLSGGMNAAQAQTLAYVSNACSQAVVVVDIANSSVVTTIPVDGPGAIQITPDGSRVYLATFGTSVSVIDTSTNTIIDTIPVDSGVGALAIARDGTRLYAGGTSVSAIDTRTNTVIATISVNAGSRGLAVTPDGTRVYATLADDGNVGVIDTSTNTVIATIPVGFMPRGVAITPDRTRAYALAFGSNSIAVIDTTTNTVTATVRVDGLPTQIAITPDGTRAYVMNEHNHNISVIDTATNTVIDIIPINFPIFMEFTSNGALAYLLTGLGSIPGSNSIVGLDMATHAVISEVNVKSCSRRFALTSDSLIPTTQDDCKDGGYRRFGPPAGPFRNQGQCVSYVESQSRRRR
jgi:YVTN family beta-propeller protein